MDLTQIVITVGALVGIVVVAALAIVPTLMDIPNPRSTESTRRPPTGNPATHAR